jgi:CheY-like chemotaxis protein
MDIRMPVMDGLDAMKHLKSDSGTKGIPIIAVTAQAMAEDQEKALKVGADGIITKPVDIKALVNEIGRFLGVGV